MREILQMDLKWDRVAAKIILDIMETSLISSILLWWKDWNKKVESLVQVISQNFMDFLAVC